MGKLSHNRGGGGHRKVGVNPPSVSFEFTPKPNELLPMTIDDMVARAVGSGYRDADSEPARFGSRSGIRNGATSRSQ